MSEQSARRLMSSNSLKLVAGGVSLLALALLALLAVGFFSNDSSPVSTLPAAMLSGSPSSRTAVALPSGSPSLCTEPLRRMMVTFAFVTDVQDHFMSFQGQESTNGLSIASDKSRILRRYFPE